MPLTIFHMNPISLLMIKMIDWLVVLCFAPYRQYSSHITASDENEYKTIFIHEYDFEKLEHIVQTPL